ncbi:hypothetical protein ACOTTU_05865 [Roseobacter sp. EG26]|uniref:hypothetical protein n=1 Tax=Roseobacter sp. EG26 TaxID=3412477 RepID=UPI003CE4A406
MVRRPTRGGSVGGFPRSRRRVSVGRDLSIGRNFPDRGVFVPRPIDFVGNLFETRRRGTPVVRPTDLLALRIEMRNLRVKSGSPPVLRKTGSGAALLILHFPPQAITEETFFEASRPGMEETIDDPTLDPKPEIDAPGAPSATVPPPFGRTANARIADESRLVFKVPDDAVIPYTLDGILTAVQSLEPKVAANARARQIRRRFPIVEALLQANVVASLNPIRRAALSNFAAASMRIAATDPGNATLMRRQIGGGTGFTDVSRLKPGFRIPGILQIPPKPAKPNSTTTAIEIPWRLILSPHKDTRWRHATQPVTSTATNHTELWHSRLVAPDEDGTAIEPPAADKARTVRAIWAKTGEASKEAMTSSATEIPDLEPSLAPFRMPMDDFDRIQIAHESSNFSLGTPNPIDTNLMMMTALGGWLDSRGTWDPPGGFSVQEWVHRASMARDHYVKVVYNGCLCPLNFHVSLVKVTERKFHNGARNDENVPQIEQIAGNTAYLRQRMFIVPRERVRYYGEADLRSNDGKTNLPLKFPFAKVELLTERTPNLDDPQDSDIDGKLQQFFWPSVLEEPYKFQCVGTDLDGRRVAFEIPMIFMDNTFATPFHFDENGKRGPDYHSAEINAHRATEVFRLEGDRKTVSIKRQRVALASSLKSGDTSVEVEEMDFGGFAEEFNSDLRNASNELERAPFVPVITGMDVRIGALSHLTGSNASNRLTYHPHYLEHGFNQKGEVFAKVEKTFNMAKLDFSAQADRSGGFVQPNLEPQALSRLAGPIMGDVQKFAADGMVPPGGGFPESISDLPLPLIFGCIPLNKIIELVSDLTDTPEQVPKFGTEASTQIESFINALVRLITLATEIASQPASIANAALTTFLSTLEDHIQQTLGLAAAQAAAIETAIDDAKTQVEAVATEIGALLGATLQTGQPAPDFTDVLTAVSQARSAIEDLQDAANAQVGGVSLPAGLRQQLLSTAQTIDAFLLDLQKLPALVATGKDLFDALDAIVGQPEVLGTLFEDPGELAARVGAVETAIGDFKPALADIQLLNGAPKTAILDGLQLVQEAFGVATDLLELVEMLTGDELTIRFDWNPKIGSFPASDPIFRANDPKGFSVAVEAKVKKDGSASPKISVTCGLKHFDLVLIAPASFIELIFEKIEFRIDSAAKMDVDVQFTDIKFVGVLSFVETLRDLIPLDGFSDPPFLDITPQGIDAGFSIALPGITCGILNIQNLSLGAGFTVPFIGQPLSVRFNFCTREQPFLLTVYMFGGGGFFGITIDPNGVQILEASFEFGASISIDLGVASGGVSVMAGIYFRMEQDEASLTGYFRLAGHVDVLGLITASLELYLELRYEFQSGKCVGKASLTIEISVFIFSGSVTVSCERKFAGSNGDPNLRQMLGLQPELPLAQELDIIDSEDVEYAWRDHIEAFA